jgi:hypothetical protein
MAVNDQQLHKIHFTQDEERPEDRFIVASHQKRQVDIKVIAALIRVASRHVGKWAASAVERQDCTLNQHGQGEAGSPTKRAFSCANGYAETTRYEKPPTRPYGRA